MPPKSKSAVAPLDALYFQHYRDYSAKYPGNQVAILLLVGKFYEMYDSIRNGIPTTNVQAAAAACGCSAEPKPTDDPGRQRVSWGVPEIALAKYERMLVAAGYTVVVFDQSKEGPAVTSRPLCRVSSPGTYLDEDEGAGGRCGEDRNLLGVCIEPYTDTTKRQRHWYGAATAFDVTTGLLRSTEFDLLLLDGKPVMDSLRSFLALFPPVEVVVTWLGEDKTAVPSVEMCRSLFGEKGANVHVFVAPRADGTAAADRARLDFLERVFKPRTALSLEHFLDIERHPFVRKSLAYLLSFVKDHNASFLSAIPDHAMWSAETACLLGNNALHQLSLTSAPHDNLSLLDWLLKSVTTTMGKRALKERCVKPTADIAVLEERQERCAALRELSRAASLF
jgi:DNA mismatch repair ATPase MutS